MVLQIDFIDETMELRDEDVDFVKHLLNYAAQEEVVQENSEVSITVVSNTAIQEINRTYRGKDEPTDVISFAMEELGEGEIEVIGSDMPRVLGDIIISLEKTREQAQEYGHTFARELGFLAIHGFLHLLGYDHMDEKEEKIMFKRQKQLLDGYGLER